MRRSNELTARKRSNEVVNDLPLPLRVKVQINLVDQHDRFGLGGWVTHLWVGLGKASREIEHQCQHAAFTVRQLPHGDCATAAV
jgi:hypothetical protein